MSLTKAYILQSKLGAVESEELKEPKSFVVPSNAEEIDFIYVGRLSRHTLYTGSAPHSCWLVQRFVRDHISGKSRRRRRHDLRLTSVCMHQCAIAVMTHH